MKVLFINHSQRTCGVQQFGENTFNFIKESKKIDFHYALCNSWFELQNTLLLNDTKYLLINYYPSTLPWINHSLLDHLHSMGKVILAIYHEVPLTGFDYYIHPDPTFLDADNRFRVGRALFDYGGDYPQNSIPVVGSFGFGFENKGWERILYAVHASMSKAIVRFHMPYAYFGDRDGSSARNIARRCISIASTLGLTLSIDHSFYDTEHVLDFLASNDINCFFYDELYGRGIASTTDYALSVKRPIAITDSYMFRHISFADPPILIEKLTLHDIWKNGTKPLEPFYEQFTKENLIKDYERVFERIA